MKALQLKNFLIQLESDGNDLNDIEVYFRYNYDSDVVPLRHINEDLFDEETGTKLKSICIMNREDDVDRIMTLSEQSRNTINEIASLCSGEVEEHIFDMGFYQGYNKAKENTYTEEQLLDALKYWSDLLDMDYPKREQINKIIQSLKQPK